MTVRAQQHAWQGAAGLQESRFSLCTPRELTGLGKDAQEAGTLPKHDITLAQASLLGLQGAQRPSGHTRVTPW